MAKFTPGVGFGQASGSVGAVTYSRNRYGVYMRRRAAPVNPRTTAQGTARARFGNLSQQWRTLTAAQRTEWNAQAPNVTLYNSLGAQYTPSGAQYFVGLNVNRLQIGIAVATTPPALEQAAVITSASVVSTGSTGVQTVTFAPAIASGKFYILEATAPMSAGKAFVGRSQFKAIAVLSNTDTSPYVATSAYAAVFGGITANDVGKRIAWRLTPVGSSGQKGAPLNFTNVVA